MHNGAGHAINNARRGSWKAAGRRPRSGHDHEGRAAGAQGSAPRVRQFRPGSSRECPVEKTASSPHSFATDRSPGVDRVCGAAARAVALPCASWSVGSARRRRPALRRAAPRSGHAEPGVRVPFAALRVFKIGVGRDVATTGSVSTPAAAGTLLEYVRVRGRNSGVPHGPSWTMHFPPPLRT